MPFSEILEGDDPKLNARNMKKPEKRHKHTRFKQTTTIRENDTKLPAGPERKIKTRKTQLGAL